MNFGIAAKLGLLLAVVGMLAAGITGFYAYTVSRNLLIDSAKGELLTATQVLARRIVLAREEGVRNLQILARHPATLAALQGAGHAREDELAALFRLFMETNPAYFQIRLIAADDDGMERVRLDRDGGRLLRITGEELQEKGHYPYVFDTLKLAAGQVYMSRISINDERGSHAALGQPAVQYAVPVMDAHGVARGVVVTNADVGGFFALLAKDLPQDVQLFLTNRRGDYLVHPDPALTFGFDKGRRTLVQDEFPDTRPLVEGYSAQVVTEARDGRYASRPTVAAFIALRPEVTTEESRVILGLAQPLQAVLEQADALGSVTLQIVLGLCLAGIPVAAVLAGAITRPINDLSVAVERFSDDGHKAKLPLERQDEIGLLARSFGRLRNQIRQQLAELHESRLELEHLAQHDTLTGLPNRALFDDRVNVAVATARREDARFALLFIDLDRFKPINDNLGHAAGDLVLRGVAGRILDIIRESDTAARIGGDEFVILLRNVHGREDAASVAQKLAHAIGQPFEAGGRTVSVSASVGIALYPEDGTDVTTLSKHADRAMYRAKEQARA
ncbi:GGDEF domain-containing protein [Thauera sinica]|uniref:Diguanylate cyclase domain-containing protein n=1 Tax=Thauera sinica TaxID=2665146 RepID=A0ABW1AYK3_9RHOO|nr:GGDEF domain-containing protein [Thauera sp. K11]ATE60203.1 GGDEF domain-containing protein [Thauera sp. K11]